MKVIVRYQSRVVRHNLELIRTWRENRMIGKGGHMILLGARIQTGCEQVTASIASPRKILAGGNFPLRSTPRVCPITNLTRPARIFALQSRTSLQHGPYLVSRREVTRRVCLRPEAMWRDANVFFQAIDKPIRSSSPTLRQGKPVPCARSRCSLNLWREC